MFKSVNATAPDIFVAIASITMMGLGSIDIAEKKVKQNGSPVYLYNFGYKSETLIPGTDYQMGQRMQWISLLNSTIKFLPRNIRNQDLALEATDPNVL